MKGERLGLRYDDNHTYLIKLHEREIEKILRKREKQEAQKKIDEPIKYQSIINYCAENNLNHLTINMLCQYQFFLNEYCTNNNIKILRLENELFGELLCYPLTTLQYVIKDVKFKVRIDYGKYYNENN